MAYAAIISLKLTLQNTLLHPSRYSIPCEKRDIESLYEKFELLRLFLEEYPSRESNECETSLERRIGDAACGAEVLMAIHLNNPSHSKDFLSSVRSKARNYPRHLVAAFKNDTYKLYPYKKEIMGRINIKAVIKKVDSLLDEVTKIKEQMGLEIVQGRGSLMEEEIKIGSQQDCEPGDDLRQDSSKLKTKSLMVGFDDHLEQIMDHFSGQSDAREVISIVGMGGIGKTTLATHVYNDRYVVDRFDVRVWATVSQSYSVRGIQLGMLDSMKILTKEMYRESDAKLGLRVYQNLKGRRYLITIDDIWDTNAWDRLKLMFPDENIGSRIILTTRSANVAAYATPSGALHHISLLSDVQSWMLLCAKVFGDEPCPPNLQEIGKKIAHNCRGLPLSIVVIGGLLSKETRTQGAWQSIAANVTSSSADQCSDILRLSYNHLPQYLKACFLYMGGFPKSHEYFVSKITRMWVAEGFLGQIQGQSSEQVAEKCVEDLVDRSLILLSKKNSEGKIKAFKIHDLLLDFCLKEAKREKFLQTIKSWSDLLGSDLASERRIIIDPVKAFVHPIKLLNHRIKVFKHILFGCDYASHSSYVRSLVCLGPYFFGSSVFLRLKLLIVLDAAKVEFFEFPYQVLELLNLRYIALTYDGHTPASITKLWNLQTLIILGDSLGFIKNRLPVDIWMMAHLRHVRCDGAYLFGSLAAKFDFYRKHLVLENLQTLSGLWNLRFSKEMLQSIPNIQKINVLYDSRLRIKKWPDYQLENLANLHQLKALKIRVISFRESYNYLNTSPMFKFCFPPSLKKLALGGVGIQWHDLAIIGLLPNLEVLKLFDHACLGTEWKPNEEEFLKLKVLTLQSLNLEHWRADSGHFPSLQCLIIRWCYGLVEIPSAMGESPTLTTIELDGCNDSVLNSAYAILEKQKSYENDAFQVIYHKRSIWHNLAKERFLEEYPSHESNGNVTFLERRIRDAAYGAEDFMDLHLNNPCHDLEIKARNYVTHLVAAFKNDTDNLYPNKEEMIMGRTDIKLMVKKVDSLIEDVMKIKEQMGLEIEKGRVSLMEEAIKIGKDR